jgi:uncharacterized protein YprB with RNaseH-like and TPR domain
MDFQRMKSSQTFIHMKGIGPKANLKLIEAGINHWGLALDASEELPLTKSKRDSFLTELDYWCQEIKHDRWTGLITALPPSDHWRVLADNLQRCSYFDIETDGLSMYEGEPTVIVCYHKGKVFTYTNGDNLDDFPKLLDQVEMLVSFNGSSFDVPYVQTYFNIPTLPCPHLDLRWICYHKGLDGGLKSIEKQMGLQRDDAVCGVDGREAIYLWQKWKRYGMEDALDRLTTYCCADVLGLSHLAKELQFL